METYGFKFNGHGATPAFINGSKGGPIIDVFCELLLLGNDMMMMMVIEEIKRHQVGKKSKFYVNF
jgi:hypothetical protein